MDLIARLKKFRQTAYKCLCKAKNATFELMDAVLLTRNAYSLVDLSICPIFRRKCEAYMKHYKIQDRNVRN